LLPISQMDASAVTDIRYVLTDMDETLTRHGRLQAATYRALEDLQSAGVKVIINTAAPAGWCDQMARMWPVDGVIGENGGLFFRRDTHGSVIREFWHDDPAATEADLKSIAAEIMRLHPDLSFADDQPFRQTSIVFNRNLGPVAQAEVADSLHRVGAKTALNNLWLLAWIGQYDKLAMARRILKAHFSFDIDTRRSELAYVGDSENDGPMFEFFEHTFGVSTVVEALDRLIAPPRWITKGPGGAGFVEVASAIIQASAASYI